jgi:hypothetical protein
MFSTTTVDTNLILAINITITTTATAEQALQLCWVESERECYIHSIAHKSA